MRVPKKYKVYTVGLIVFLCVMYYYTKNKKKKIIKMNEDINNKVNMINNIYDIFYNIEDYSEYTILSKKCYEIENNIFHIKEEHWNDNMYNNVDNIIPDILLPFNSINIAGIVRIHPQSSISYNPNNSDTLTISICISCKKGELVINDNTNKYKKNLENGELLCFNTNYEHTINNNGDNVFYILYINFRTDYIYCSKTEHKNNTMILNGYPYYMNVILSRDLSADIYSCSCEYSDCVLIVDNSLRLGTLYFKQNDNMDYIKKCNNYYLYDLKN